ncbi:iron-sulfur assembly protein IscA-like protein 2 [Scenedesmus sp. PABB004]|nr:iron-sulfur assembly protein IscA-like protein 2 [Scenedesmus sp. PABB004]
MLRSACDACRAFLSLAPLHHAQGDVAVPYAACSLLQAVTARAPGLGGTRAASGAAAGAAAAPAAGGLVLHDSAVQRLKELQAEAPGRAVMLRIEVEGGGCSGFQYKFRLDDASAAADDHVFERDGAAVVCDAVSLDFLRGAVVEYEDSLMRSAFQIAANPNSESTCGCGTSFVAKF